MTMHDVEQSHSSASYQNDVVDRVLLSRIAKRDTQALARLYDRHSSLIYRLALRVLGDRAAAETIVMEVFALIWESPERIAATGPVESALIMLTWRQTPHLPPQRGQLSARMGAASDHHQPTAWRVPVDPPADAIRALPPEQRTILELSYYEWLPVADIAIRLNLPTAVVQDHLRHGVRTLYHAVFGKELPTYG
jgi:RNA polymerase sigma-70 factor (ECF subfamily)